VPDLPTRLDLFSIGRAYVLERAAKIDPAQVDVEGSDVNIIVGVSSVIAAQLVNQLAYRTSALFLDGADGEDLDRFAYDRFSLTRKGASAALTSVQMTRATVAAGSGTIPIGTKVQSNTSVEYVTTTTATFGAADLISSADVRASQAGKATQVGANAIVRFSNPSGIFDPSIQVTNAEASAGGEDAEDDDTFRARVRDFWRTARRGILAAIEFGALTVPGIVSAQAIEALTPGGQPARVVNLFIADSSGVASAALAEQVRVALDDFRAGGIQVIISTSLPLLVQVTLRLRFRANVDTASLTDQVRDAIVAFVNSQPVNGTLYLAQLYSMLQRFSEDGLITDQGTIVAPTGDLVPATGQTIRTTPDRVTVVP
jgi:uncharacterized phage protein gp47/JayE